MKFFRICLFLLVSSPIVLNAQLFKDSREMFLEAESYALFEEYNEALPLYLALFRENRDNDYLKYMLGICYLNTPGQKEKAIPYLEQAIENIDWKNRPATYRTSSAPPDALFYLAQAYHVNYQFQEALKYFNRFKNEANSKVFNLELVEEYITASKNALETIKSPLFFLINNLDEPLNSRFSEMNPVVSKNEEVIVFTRKLPFYDGVFFSRKINEEWTEPMDITPMIGSDGDCYPVSLSHDGTELYLYKVDNYIGNIYTSNYINGEWTKVKKLNENINTKYWESHASVSSDGNTLYFTSNRPGGFGGLDIWVSERGPNGDWGPAKNIGKPVNSEFNEETPFITEDGNTLYYSSYGYYNIGGYDVFYSSKMGDGTWSVPLNAGYPISTPDDDLFFYPLLDGRYAYIARSNPDRVNAVTDLYRLEIFSETHPRKFRIYGTLGLADNVKVSPMSRVLIVDNTKGDTLFAAVPDSLSGQFDFELAQGDYKIVFTEEGFENKTVDLNLPVNNPESEIQLFATLEPALPAFDSTFYAEKEVLPWYSDSVPVSNNLGIKNHQIRVSTGDPVEIGMNLDKGTKLRVETWMDNKLVKVDTFEIDSRNFVYKMNPLPGRTQLKIFYLDKDNRLIRDELSIAYVPVIEPETPKITTLNERLQTFYNEMIKESGGDLRTVLLNIDFQKENITTPEDLINYLVLQSEFHDYTNADVRMALLGVASKNKTDVKAFLATLIMKSQDPLYSVLKEIDIEKEGITTIPQLLQVIEKRTGSLPGESQALIALATRMAVDETNREQQELAILYYELMKVSDGRIKEVLKEIEPGKSEVQSTGQLIQLLLNNAEQNNYTGKDVERLLLTVIDSKSIDLTALRRKWAGLSSPELSRLINRTQPNKNVSPEFGIYASQISANAGRAGIDQGQIMQSLTALAVSESIQARREMAILYYNMLRLADGNLKVALTNLDMEQGEISTSQELINYLVNHSDSLNYKQEDVMILMARISAEKDLQGFFAELTNLSTGNLQKLLKSVDLKRDNINTVDELIALLLEKAPEYGYSQEEIISIVGQLSIARSMGNQMDMLLLKQNLAALGKQEIRLTLENLDESENRITTPEELLEYLTSISDSAGYTPDDVWDVVFELGTEGQRDIRELISSMKTLADERILKVLRDIERDNLSFSNIKELMDYLVLKGEENNYTEEDVKYLMLQQALENQKLLKDKKEKKPDSSAKRYWFYLILLLIAVILAYRYLRKAKKQ
jgi:hypothetical protein